MTISKSDIANLPAAYRAEVARQMGEKVSAKAAQHLLSHAPGKMNKTEARYADHLKLRVAAGEVIRFYFEAIKLRIAERCFYTPDFLVLGGSAVAWDGFEFHEVKGRKGESYYAQEDAVVKIKAAAALFPYWTFRIVWPAPGSSGWREKVIKP